MEPAFEFTLEELKQKRAALEAMTTLELAYLLGESSFMAGEYFGFGQYKVEDRELYNAAMSAAEDCLDILDVRLQ